MSLNAAALKIMADKGLSAQDIAAIAEALESTTFRSAAAVRQKRYRDGKRNERDVTRDVTNPPIEDHTPHSVSDETGGKPPDPVKIIFDTGIDLLTSQGHTEKQARSLVGKWREGGRRDGDVAAALVDAKRLTISNLVEWMPKRLNGTGRRGTDPPSYLDYLTSQPAGATQ